MFIHTHTHAWYAHKKHTHTNKIHTNRTQPKTPPPPGTSDEFKNNLLNKIHVFDIKLSNCQIGFRKGKRTSDHIFVLKCITEQAKRSKQPIYGCFIDFKKAVDTVWIKGLLYKLLCKYSISPKFVRILNNTNLRSHVIMLMTLFSWANPKRDWIKHYKFEILLVENVNLLSTRTKQRLWFLTKSNTWMDHSILADTI